MNSNSPINWYKIQNVFMCTFGNLMNSYARIDWSIMFSPIYGSGPFFSVLNVFLPPFVGQHCIRVCTNCCLAFCYVFMSCGCIRWESRGDQDRNGNPEKTSSYSQWTMLVALSPNISVLLSQRKLNGYGLGAICLSRWIVCISIS